MPFVSNEDYGLEEASLETTSAVTESIKEVRGAFAFDQTTTVATASIVEVFNKAAATLCSAMPQYAMDAQGRPVCVKSPNTSFTATVDELSDEEGAQSYIIGWRVRDQCTRRRRDRQCGCAGCPFRVYCGARGHLVGSGNAVAEGDRRVAFAVCRGCVVGC